MSLEIERGDVGFRRRGLEGRGEFPQPIHAEGKDHTYVGRVRKDLGHPNGLSLWVVADNLRKGAATNAVQCAEALLRMGVVK